MHIYEPDEFEHVGWSQPRLRPAEISPPSRLRTAAAIILLLAFGLAGILFWFTAGHL